MSETTTETTTEGSGQQQSGQSEQAVGKTFTQDEVNKLLGDRVARERAKFADYDQLKADAAELGKVREAGKTELQRAVDAARKEGAATALQASNTRLVAAEARALAATARFRDPLDAIVGLGDLSTVKVSADGQVDTATLQAAIDDLAKRKPYLLLDDKPTRPTGDAGQGPRDNKPSGHGLMNDMIRARSGHSVS